MISCRRRSEGSEEKVEGARGASGEEYADSGADARMGIEVMGSDEDEDEMNEKAKSKLQMAKGEEVRYGNC